MTELSDLGAEEFVSLVTYRRTGVPVATTVWIAPGPDADDALIVTTTARSGKVKRLRHDPRATLSPCGRHGELAPDAPTVAARAALVEDPDEVRRLREAIRAKYGERMKVTAADEGSPAAAREPARVIVRLTGAPGR